ncbi:MAG: T9SS type A sorting domain-containing protein [Bacteroidetes bacterium]|nr:T9SS type A sorting domain-containing protein [Bacteroidota bacterium]
MKKLLILSLLFLSKTIFAQHGIDPHWGPEYTIPKTNPGASAGGGVPNNIVVLPNGTCVSFYTEQFPFPNGTIKSYYAGTSNHGVSWNAPAPALVPPVNKTQANAGSVGAAVDKDGNIHISWTSIMPAGIFYAKWNYATQTWSDTVRVNQRIERQLSYQMITVDRKNRIHIIWMDGKQGTTLTSEVMYARSTNGGTSFLSQIQLSNSDGKHSAFPMGDFIGTASDTLAIAWRDSVNSTQQWDISTSVSTNGGQSWSAQSTVSGGAGTQSDPNIVVDKNRVMHIVYHDYYTSGCVNEFCAKVMYGYSTNNGLTWNPSGFRQISPANLRAHLTKTAYDFNNNIFWAAYKDERDFNFLNGNPQADIAAVYILNGGTYISPVNEFVTDKDSLEVGYHNFAVGNDGILRAVYRSPDGNNSSPYSQCYKERQSVLSISQNSIEPDGFSLEQNFPNPFNPETFIQFTLGKNDIVRLIVYDVLGNKVADLADGKMEEGVHTIKFNAGNLPSGTYFYRLQTEKFIQTKKMLLIK